jgi:hypothetical protein
MQVKKCPKCGAENKPANTSCSKCYAAIDNVPLTESKAADESAVAAAPRAAQPGPPPAAARPMPPAPGHAASVPPQTPASVRPGVEREAPPIRITIGPPHRKPYALIAVVALVVAGAVTGTIVLTRPKPPPPAPEVPANKVVLSFLEAKKTKRVSECQPYMSKASIDFLHRAFGTKQARSAGFDEQEVAQMYLFRVAPTKEDMSHCTVAAVLVPDAKVEEETDLPTAVVHVSLDNQDKYSMMLQTEFDFVLVAEDSQWKVDLLMTAHREGRGGGGFNSLMPGGVAPEMH